MVVNIELNEKKIKAIKEINEAENKLKDYYKDWDRFIKDDGEGLVGFLSRLGEVERDLINVWDKFENLLISIDKVDINLLRRAEKGQKNKSN